MLSFVSILVLFTVTTYVNNRQGELVEENAQQVEHSTDLVRQGNRYQRNFLTMVSGLRGFLLTNEQSFRATYDSALSENKEIMSELFKGVPAVSEQRIVLDDISELQSYWIEEYASPLLRAKVTSGQGEHSAFDEIYRRKMVAGLEHDIHSSIKRKFQDFAKYEYESRKKQYGSLSERISSTRILSTALTTISIVTGLLIAGWLAWSISRRIRRMIIMANDISGGRYQVKENVRVSNELDGLSSALNNMAKILNDNIFQLNRKKEALDQFADIIAYDLKAPMKGISSTISSIRKEQLKQVPMDVREKILGVSDRVMKIENQLNSLLSYARSGKTDHYKEVVEVEELLEGIHSYTIDNPKLIFSYKKRMPVLYTERMLLEQVFTNLILNTLAVDDQQIEVVVDWRLEGDFYYFYVLHSILSTDSARERAFVNFESLQSISHPEDFEVGLSIVKRIIEERELELRMNIVPGKRSIFCFTWPKNEIDETTHYQYSVGRQ